MYLLITWSNLYIVHDFVEKASAKKENVMSTVLSSQASEDQMYSLLVTCNLDNNLPVFSKELLFCIFLPGQVTDFWSVQGVYSDDLFVQDPVQEWGEEVEDGAIYGITLHREPIQPPPDAPFGFMQYRTQKVRRLKAATLERLVTELVNSECPDPDYMQIFLSTYRAFTCTDALIELLFQRWA